MGLEDKFYPPEDSYLTKFDNAMIRTMGRVGEAYQQVTGRSATELLKPFYIIAAAGCVISVPPCNPAALLMGARIYDDYAKNPPAQSPLEEEMQYEAAGQPRYFGKFLRASMLFVYASVTLAKYIRDPAVLEQQNSLDRAAEITLPIFAYSLLTFALTDYLAKSNIPTPPKESLPRKILNSLQSLVSTPTPVTNQ